MRYVTPPAPRRSGFAEIIARGEAAQSVVVQGQQGRPIAQIVFGAETGQGIPLTVVLPTNVTLDKPLVLVARHDRLRFYRLVPMELAVRDMPAR